ncbi:MAG: hypothetical protein U0528_12015 [Anaerolineae bacterium]
MPNAQDLASQGAYDMWLAGKIAATFVVGPWDQPALPGTALQMGYGYASPAARAL